MITVADRYGSELEMLEEFARQDSIVGDVRDPYPGLLARPAVEVLTAYRGLPGEEAPIVQVRGYEAVTTVLRDSVTYSSTVYEQIMGVVMGHTILEMDEPEHLRHRSLIAQAFRTRALERWEDELIRPLVHELIDGFVDEGSANLVTQFTLQYPMKVIARILGLPREGWLDFMRSSLELISVTVDWDRGLAASARLREMLSELLEQRRTDPRDDLISELVRAEVADEEGVRHVLTDDEILPFLLLLLPAGAETTTRALGNLLFGLLTQPGQLEAVRADRSLLPQAIEEALRWEPPLLLIARVAMADTELGGVTIPRGSRLIIQLGAANRDADHVEHGDEFDIHREAVHHTSFGAGRHTCLGMHLARLEMSVAVGALIDRLPDLRLDPDGADPHIHGLTFRSPTQLPVLFTP